MRTLFATHFHELTALAEEYPGVKNYNVAVKEWKDEIVFLHRIVPGGCDDSYGIYVAKLAGIPREVINRGRQILSRLELKSDLQGVIRQKPPKELQLSFFSLPADGAADKIKDELKSVDADKLTPIDALNKIQKWKELIEDNE